MPRRDIATCPYKKRCGFVRHSGFRRNDGGDQFRATKVFQQPLMGRSEIQEPGELTYLQLACVVVGGRGFEPPTYAL